MPGVAGDGKAGSAGVVGISVRGEVREVNPLAQDPLFRQFFNLRDQPVEREPDAVGSGVIVDAERGCLLTNRHGHRAIVEQDRGHATRTTGTLPPS